MAASRKVFLSYRSVDQARVRAVAEALRTAGIDAWLDDWEILPGDNFVAKINQGLEECDCGVVFLSKDSMAGAWHQDEITILKTFAVDEKKPLIPVLLDADVEVPAILRPHSRLRADQIPQLIDAIYGRTSKPALGPVRVTASRTHFSIHLRDLAEGTIGITGRIEGKDIAPEVSIRPGPAFHFSYRDFMRGVPGARIGSPAEAAAERFRELEKLGDAIGRVVFAGEIDQALASQLKDAARDHREIDLVYETASARLLSIPFEAARLSNGPAPSLLPGVFSWRRFADNGPGQSQGPAPGPLKILVAVGAPDEDKTPNSVLDMERELQTILDAVEEARRLSNAYVRILEVGSPKEIGRALRERSYHVLHLSGHGSKGVLELEDEDGKSVPVTAKELADVIHESGHRAPLVFLASCHSGIGDEETAGFAHGLLDNGVPAVLAMQNAVSDSYATKLAGRFYTELARAENPLASRALALARRELEADRKNSSEKGRVEVSEYATPSLFVRSQEEPLLDRALEQVPVSDVAKSVSPGAVPFLKIGDLIGRRREARRLVRALTSDGMAGCQILGTGGVGKSALAGRIMQRMADRAWRVATVSGAWNLGRVASSIGETLWGDSNKELAERARQLVDPQAPDEFRAKWLQGLFTHHEVLLVLDNFEDVLTPAGADFRDPVIRQIFAMLVSPGQRGRVLITSRYPVPEAEDGLERVDLGPLSPAETRKMMLRLPALERQRDDVKAVERAIGGHPRTLEYLDALLRSEGEGISFVQKRLTKFARDAGVSLERGGNLDERIRDAISCGRSRRAGRGADSSRRQKCRRPGTAVAGFGLSFCCSGSGVSL